MARSQRYHYPGQFYHVMLKGNGGQDIFFSDTDRYLMFFLLQEGVEKYEHRIHAFCFMTNHIHLLIQVGEVSLSKIIQNLASRYSRKINRRSDKLGHLFRGRFKSILVEEQSYFIRLLHYIHRNPVEANIVATPEDYTWSSHNSYLNRNKISWLTVDYGLSKFGLTRKAAVLMYSTYLLNKETPEEIYKLRTQLQDGDILGTDNFIQSVRNKITTKTDKQLSLKAILNATCAVLSITEDLILSKSQSDKACYARGLISIIAKETHKFQMDEIGQLLKRDATTISSLISRFSLKHLNSQETKLILTEITQKAAASSPLQLSAF